MLLRTAADDRPYHLGPFPLELLPRDEHAAPPEDPSPAPMHSSSQAQGVLGRAARIYRDLYSSLADGEPAEKRAPVPDDPQRRAVDLKGYAYFMNAGQVGICRHGEEYAVVVLVEAERVPEPGNLAREWIEPAVGEVIDMRAAEIAVCLARHVRQLGFAARAHVAGNSRVDVTPLQAKERRARGGAKPLHYVPTPPRREAVGGKAIDLSKYGGGVR